MLPESSPWHCIITYNRQSLFSQFRFSHWPVSILIGATPHMLEEMLTEMSLLYRRNRTGQSPGDTRCD